MAVESGIGGDIDLGASAVAHIRSFTYSKTADNQVYASSDTETYKKTVEGQHGWAGSADIYLDGVYPVFPLVGTLYESTVFTLKSGVTVTGNIRIDAINNILTDIEGSSPASATIEFTGDGAYPS